MHVSNIERNCLKTMHAVRSPRQVAVGGRGGGAYGNRWDMLELKCCQFKTNTKCVKYGNFRKDGVKKVSLKMNLILQ